MGLMDFLTGKNKQPLVLVVDDQADVRQMVRYALEGMGYRVVEAANGREALLAAAEHSPRLILMDVVMPIMTGQQALAVLKANPDTANIPVIMVTAEQTGDDVEFAFDKGVAAYVIKPIRVAQLAEKVSKILPLPPK